MVYYGVHDPSVGGGENIDNARSPTVFEKIGDAINMIKNRKEARMRSFASRQDAIDFSVTGITRLPSQASNSVHKPLQQQEPTMTLERQIHADQTPGANGEVSLTIGVKQVIASATTAAEKLTTTPVTDKPTTTANDKPAFRSLKSQELVLFRKMIEQGKLDAVVEAVWRNPRYLIGSGDTPTILKESFRYNALHVAALAKNALMCEKLLDTIGNSDYIQLVYGKKNAQYCQDTSRILQDLYLNMPERGRNETPLHMAVKFGAVEVVEVLTSYPQCNQARNSDGMLPIDIICSRIDRVPSVVQHIRELLSGRFYVPVIRSADNSLPPTIGEPFSPKNPPKLNFDPLSPEMEIQAYAGPMNQDEAQVFRRRWKTPPRLSTNCSSPTNNLSPQRPTLELTPKRGVPSRQLFPRQLTNGSTTPTRPLPPQASTPIKSPASTTPSSIDDGANGYSPDEPAEADESLVVLDDSLVGEEVSDTQYRPTNASMYRVSRNLLDDSLQSNTSFAETPSYMERHAKLIDSEKGLEVIGRQLAKERNIKWREYWPFLDCFVDIRSADGLCRLEDCLRANAESRQTAVGAQPHYKESIGSLCDALNGLHFGSPSSGGGVANPPVLACNPQTGRIGAATPSIGAYSAYLCLEKSWQVYARRLTNSISTALARAPKEAITHIKEALVGEMRRLTALVVSYKNDVRFAGVDFDHGHSRFGHLIAGYLISDHGLAIEEIRIRLQRVEANVEPLSEPSIYCVLRNIVHHLEAVFQFVHPKARLGESDAQRLWTAEQRCACGWPRAKQTAGFQVGRKRISRRLDASSAAPASRDWSNTTTTSSSTASSTDEERSPVDNWTAQRAVSAWSSSASSSSSDDDDLYFSANSDDEDFDTPPDSPSGCDSPERKELKYRNFVMGEEPTKADGDVFNALSSVDIDRATHPHVFEWHQAMQTFRFAERSTFPSMTPLPWLTQNRCRTNSKTTTVPSTSANDGRCGSTPLDAAHKRQPQHAWSLLRRIQVDRAWRFGGRHSTAIQ